MISEQLVRYSPAMAETPGAAHVLQVMLEGSMSFLPKIRQSTQLMAHESAWAPLSSCIAFLVRAYLPPVTPFSPCINMTLLRAIQKSVRHFHKQLHNVYTQCVLAQQGW